MKKTMPLDPDRERQLEEILQHELSRLPERPAPPTLIPRVLAAIQAESNRPRWRRSFVHWPWPWTCLLVLATIPAAVGLAFASNYLVGLFVQGSLAADARQGFVWMERLGSVLSALGAALILTLRNLMTHPAVLAGLVVSAFVYLSLIGAGTLWFQLAVKNPNLHKQ
jgi:mannose/fructose/N-acetylgalactosamine-specific phosphotransferase system component IIC